MLTIYDYAINKDQIGMVLYGMRNSWNSWEDYDTHYEIFSDNLIIGENDMNLCKKLCKAGPSHRKFMRMITVIVDMTAPLHWWKQMDTYTSGKVQNSTSTMHTITRKHLSMEDFAVNYINEDSISLHMIQNTIDYINNLIDVYNMESTTAAEKAGLWRAIIDILPSSYMQRRMVFLSYETLANIYNQRKGHKLAEWKEFLEWIEELPYSEFITGKFKEDEKEEKSDKECYDEHMKSAKDILKKCRNEKEKKSDKEYYDEHMKPVKDILKKRRDENNETIYVYTPRGSSKSLSDTDAISLLAMLAAFTDIDIENILNECCKDDDEE